MAVEKLLRQLSMAVLALAGAVLLPQPARAQDLPPEVRFTYAGGPRV